MSIETRKRRPMASVFLNGDDTPFIVAETPREIAEMVRTAIRDGEPLVELTLANARDWNGKPLFCRADRIMAMCPPRDEGGDEDDE